MSTWREPVDGTADGIVSGSNLCEMGVVPWTEVGVVPWTEVDDGVTGGTGTTEEGVPSRIELAGGTDGETGGTDTNGQTDEAL